MTFSVEYSSEAVLQLGRLEKQIAKRIIAKIDASRGNPQHFLKRLSGRPEYKLRVGDYRVIIDINEGKKTLLVMSVGHRSGIYKRR